MSFGQKAHAPQASHFTPQRDKDEQGQDRDGDRQKFRPQTRQYVEHENLRLKL
jgi:hypothetical protein